MQSFLLMFVAAPAAIGFVLGALTRIRIVFLAVPPFLVAAAYWVGVGWFADPYEFDRKFLVLITGVIGGLVVSTWVIGSLVGRYVRREHERPALTL